MDQSKLPPVYSCVTVSWAASFCRPASPSRLLIRTGSPPFTLSVTVISYGGGASILAARTGSTANLLTTAAATAFICTYAISFPRHARGPAWKTGYLAASTATNSPRPSSHRSGRNSRQSPPHSRGILPMAYAQ